ncbi:MAG: hypothetical protein DIU70_010310 [Bacillota bacterium]|nr:hypothetical protein [Bacillota bacterium]PZN39617.1 MAG: hypothetical protein DIU70_09195 [Bacillota bacterium]
MRPDLVVVLQYNCATRARMLAEAIQTGLRARGLRVEALEAEVGACGYWDGQAALFVAPAHPGFPLRTPVLVAPMAYMFPTAENLRRLAESVGERLAGG